MKQQRSAWPSSHTRKMLQTIDTTCSPAMKFSPVQPNARRWTVSRGLAILLALAAPAVLAAPAALAQTPSATPDPNQSTSQTGTPQTGTAQTGTAQTGTAPQTGTKSKAPVAAPGTVAVTAATAAALQPYAGPKYDNRWEVYGGLLFMNGQAGQNLPKRFNMGGAEVMGTYWLGDGKHGALSKLGIAADGRFGAGTTPVISPYYNRVVVMEGTFMGGVQYRGPKNRYAAVDFHVLGGGVYGDFDYAVNHYLGGSPVTACAANQIGAQGTLGLYCNHTAATGAVGGSIEFNESAKLAIRLQPDLTFEHFGTETREYFAISAGAVYRFGKSK